MINGAMLFDNQNMKPLYELEIGRPGSSFAFEIAKKIGLPEQVLKSAEEKVGKDQIDFDKHLQEIEKERRRLTNLNKKLSQKEVHMENVLKKYEEETKNTIKKRKEIITEAKLAAENILSGVNKTIEQSVYEIKKTKADKEKTKKVRKDLEQLKEDTAERFKQEGKFLSKKIEKIKKKQGTEKNVLNETETVSSEISVGDKVKIKDSNSTGQVLEIKDNKMLISLGNMQMFVDKKQLLKISSTQFKKESKPSSYADSSISKNINKAKNKFSYGLDVRGKRADEALQMVTNYIDECIMVEASEVKILHGKGNGILRQLIRDYLKTIDLIKSAKDEKVDLGGAGITVVTFSY
jgi:DNA mismatch repair protein MutS2